MRVAQATVARLTLAHYSAARELVPMARSLAHALIP